MNDENQSPRMETPSLRIVEKIQDLANREPAKVIATAFGVGLLINLLPTRIVIGALTAVSVALIRPTLLTLGVTKAIELCCPKPAAPSKLN